MAQNLTTLQETTRTVDGTEYVRLATPGANWKATLASIISALVTPTAPGGSGTEIQYRAGATTFGGGTGTTWTNATRALVITGGSITTTQFILEAGSINAQVGAGYILQASDNGKIITLTNAAPISLTCPAGLGAAFSCVIIQMGAGQVGVAAGLGATLNALSGLTNLAGQYAVGHIVALTANNFVLMGQTA